MEFEGEIIYVKATYIYIYIYKYICIYLFMDSLYIFADFF